MDHTAGMSTPPPRPPFGVGLKYDADDLVVRVGFRKWRSPLSDVTVQAVDHTGQKTGAFTSNKTTGHVTLVISNPAGETRQIRVQANMVKFTLDWAAAFQAWQAAVYQR